MRGGKGRWVGGSTVKFWTLIERQRIQIKDCFGGGGDGRRGQEAGQGYRAKRGVCGEPEQYFSLITHCLNLIHIIINFLFKIFPTVTLLWLAQEEPQNLSKGCNSKNKKGEAIILICDTVP